MPLCHLRGALINPQGTSSKDPEDTDPASPFISGDTGCHPPLLLLPGGLAVDPQEPALFMCQMGTAEPPPLNPRLHFRWFQLPEADLPSPRSRCSSDVQQKVRNVFLVHHSVDASPHCASTRGRLIIPHRPKKGEASTGHVLREMEREQSHITCTTV